MLKARFEVPAPFNREAFESAFKSIAEPFKMTWDLYDTGKKERVAILVWV